jgi:hypothetical protein
LRRDLDAHVRGLDFRTENSRADSLTGALPDS